MRRILFLIFIALPVSAHAKQRQPLVESFKPYVGVDLSLAFVDYNENTIHISDKYGVVTVNAGARLNKCFGAEIFYGYSFDTNTEKSRYTNEYNWMELKTEISYQIYGANIQTYYNIFRGLDAIISVGVANFIFETDAYYREMENGVYDGIDTTVSTHRAAPRVGIGAIYNLNRRAGIRTMFMYAPVRHDFFHQVSELKIGVRYTF